MSFYPFFAFILVVIIVILALRLTAMEFLVVELERRIERLEKRK